MKNYELWIFCALSTAALSFGQAWVLRRSGFSVVLHAVLWVAVTLFFYAFTVRVFGTYDNPVIARTEKTMMLGLAGGLCLLALAAGAYWRRQPVQKAPDLMHAAFQLAGLHSALIFVGAMVALAVVLLTRLGRAEF